MDVVNKATWLNVNIIPFFLGTLIMKKLVKNELQEMLECMKLWFPWTKERCLVHVTMMPQLKFLGFVDLLNRSVNC